MTVPGTRDFTADGGDFGPDGSFSVMLPASRSPAELDATLARLLTGDAPPSEVLVVVADGDEEAREVAERAAAGRPGLVQVVDEAALFEAEVEETDDGEVVGAFSLMMPAPPTEAELEATLARLMLGDDPPSEVLLLVGADDVQAREVAKQAAVHHPRLVKVVDEAALFETPAPRVALDEAPGRSAWQTLRRVLVAAAVIAVVALSIRTGTFIYLAYVSVSLVLGVIAGTTLVWMLHAWRTPASLAASGLGRGTRACAFSFSLIVPARHEEAVLESTLSRLVGSDHPDFEIVVVVGDDDPGTRDAAERVAAQHPDRVRVVVDPSLPKSKPRALNNALPYCSGAITGVFDAEDDVHPGLLDRVDTCFQRTQADVVQAGVQLMNFRSSWLTVRNVLEYYFWFRSRLHFHADQRFIPLGGNTVFIRTDLLREVGGWDAECLAEDCELGVRLSSLGAKTVVFYEPDLVTREECPPTLRAFAKQRTRWNQGYLQTLKKGYWRRLPFRQRVLAHYTLATPYVMALVWLTIPMAITTALLVKAPVPITLISFLPAIPMLCTLAVEVAALGDFCKAYGQRPSPRDYLRLVLGLLVYQSVLAIAAVRAVVREARGNRSWEKTEHLGLHLTQADRFNGNGHHNGNGHGSPSLSLPLPLPMPRPRGAPAPAVTRSRPAAVGVLLRRAISVDVLLVVALLTIVALVQATNMLHWPNRQFDEGTYIANAWAVHHGALAPYTYSYGHPPLGWLMIAAWTWARGIFGAGGFSIDSGRELMLVVSVVSSGLVFMLARRLGMNRVFAAVAVLLFALSPVSLFFHRAVLLDNVTLMWTLAAFVFVMTPKHRLWAFAASGACFAAAALSKETILVILPALALAAIQNADKRTRRYCWTLLGSFFFLLALSFPLYAALKGELLPGAGHVSLVGYAIIQLVTREATGSLFDSQSETYAIVHAWLGLDPWLLGAALVLSPLALARRSTRAVAAAFLIQVVLLLRPGYLPNMYVIGLLPFAALIVAGQADALWRKSRLTPSHVRAWGLRAATAGLAIATLLVVAPRWVQSDAVATSQRVDGDNRAASQWLATHVGHDKRLIVADEYWLYLVEHGFDSTPVRGGFFSRNVVMYWPFDYDPAVKKRFPNGWRDFDFVVSTEAVRSTLRLTPMTGQALRHSRVVVQFGRGAQRIEIRAITGAHRFG